MIVECDHSSASLEIFSSLRDSQLRISLEGREGIFIAEGEKIIQRAWEAGCRPHSFLLCRKWLPALQNILSKTDVPVYLTTEESIEKISGFHIHRGALGAFYRHQETSWDELLSGDRLIVAEGLVDHANMGAIMRITAALGWDGVVIDETCADPLYRRAIKASMGYSLQIPWRRMTAGLADLEAIRRAGFSLVAASLGDAVDLASAAKPSKIALLLGNEGHGLSSQWLATADQRVRIPMANGVDSLNVAAAAAIFAYEFRRSLTISILDKSG